MHRGGSGCGCGSGGRVASQLRFQRFDPQLHVKVSSGLILITPDGCYISVCETVNG